MSLYDELNINKDASQEEIKKAYRDKAKENHPDKTGGDSTKMVRINKAYNILSDEDKRKLYDETGNEDQVKTSFEKKFEAFINSVFIELCMKEEIESTNMIDLLSDHCKVALQGMKVAQGDFKGKLKKLQTVKDRLIKKDNNAISGVLDHHITMMEQNVNKTIIDIEFLGQVQEELNTYGYKFEEKEKTQGFSVRFGRTEKFSAEEESIFEQFLRNNKI